MLEYAFVTLKSMYHLATASVCVLDSYWPAVSVLHHKKQLAVIQMWHAMGKIKKSGYQSLGKKFGRSDMIAREMRMTVTMTLSSPAAGHLIRLTAPRSISSRIFCTMSVCLAWISCARVRTKPGGSFTRPTPA